MKNILFLFCLIAVQVNAQSSKTISNSDIKEVKIFQAGAQITRIVKASVNAGVTQLKVEGLSEYVNKNSISVSGTGDVVLLSVTQQLDYLNSEKKQSEQSRLEDSLEFWQAKRIKSEDFETVYKDEKALLQANKSTGGANVGVSMENLQKVADFFRMRMIELNSKLADIRNEQKVIDEKTLRIQQQLKELDAKQNQATGTIIISVSAKAQVNVSLELSYYVTGAGWTPRYDLRSKDINSPVQLAYKANVFQKTGEKWDDVKLKLSSGNPSQNGSKPSLNPWYIDFYYPRPAYGYNKSKVAETAEYNMPLIDKDVRGSRSDDSAYYVDGIRVKGAADFVSVDENQLATEFDIAIPYSIPSDGKMHAVDVQSFSLPALYSYYAVPKLDKDAFLIARLTKWEELNLLPGMATVYFEGAYVGESAIDPGNTKDTLDVSLGRDKRIVITRERKKDLSSSKFIGANVEKDLHYLITVRNSKKDKITIVVEDQVPVTKNSDISVKVNDYSDGTYTQETGKITWKMDIAPATSTEKKLNYSVKYPKDKTVNGLQ